MRTAGEVLGSFLLRSITTGAASDEPSRPRFNIGLGGGG